VRIDWNTFIHIGGLGNDLKNPKWHPERNSLPNSDKYQSLIFNFSNGSPNRPR
jgi:hypothetical protein